MATEKGTSLAGTGGAGRRSFLAIGAVIWLTACSDETTPQPDCTANQQCIDQLGGPAVCGTSQTCTALTSEDCTDVDGDIANDDVILLGGLGPIVGEYASSGIATKEGAQLALQEVGLLPGGAAGRPVALVSCHDFDEPERAAKHLVDVVKVPAIVGANFSGVTLKVAQNVTIPAGVLMISPSATSPAITDLADQGLVWRTVPSDALQAIPLAQLVAVVEDKVRTKLSLAATDKVRVALTVKGDAYGIGLADAVSPQMTVNGEAVAGDNAKNVLRVDYADPEEAPSIDFAKVVADVVAFQPHIVLSLGTNEVVTEIVAGVEASWPTDAAALPRPEYLLPDGGKVPELIELVGADDNLRERVLGTVPGVATPSYAGFVERYTAAFGAAPSTFAENAYDAAYLLAFSAVVAGNDLSGARLAEGLKRLVPPGTAIDLGPDTVKQAIDALVAGDSVDVGGVSGALDFDLSTGEVETDIDIWCIGRDGGGEAVFESSGQYYSATDDALVGSIACR